ncbi:MAG: hypothetical protein QF773_05070 [Lentisphaeria bacterium]|jgi:hypothetical protein|nr:hypothetical protein [Lentisphaeria bacterium]
MTRPEYIRLSVFVLLILALHRASGCPACGADAVGNSNVVMAYVVTTFVFSLLPLTMAGVFVLWHRRQLRARPSDVGEM